MGLKLIVAGVFTSAALTVSGASALAGHAPFYDPCPTKGTIRDATDASAAITGAFGSIRRLFPQINYGQGRTDPVTRRTTVIREVIELNRTTPDALRFGALAARRCGVATARRSWAVVAVFPLAPMASTSQIAFFVVDTSQGWRLYGDVLDHH